MDFAEAAEQLELEDKQLDAEKVHKKQRVAKRQSKAGRQQKTALLQDLQFDLSCQRSEEPDIQTLSPTKSQDSGSTRTTETDLSKGMPPSFEL